MRCWLFEVEATNDFFRAHHIQQLIRRSIVPGRMLIVIAGVCACAVPLSYVEETTRQLTAAVLYGSVLD